MWTIVSRKRLNDIENRLARVERDCKELNSLVFNRVHKDEVCIWLDRELNHCVTLREAVQMVLKKLGMQLKYVPQTAPEYVLEDVQTIKKEK